MLEIVGLTGGWGPTTIVEHLDLSVAAGETVAVVGRNGVGKTTLLELIAGRAQLRSGEIRSAAATFADCRFTSGRAPASDTCLSSARYSGASP